jgi:serine/threonine protein kinase
MLRTMMELSPGYRDSSTSAVARGDLVGSVYAIRHEVVRTETGTVFEARDMLLDRLVALKLGWRDPDAPSMILEARRCASVRAPCAVAIHGMGRHDGLEYVVGERVTGTLLREQLRSPLPTDVYLARLRAIVEAVARAHAAGIAIGEISASTILDDGTGRLVLGRLSLSQVPAFGPRDQILAPEVVRGDVEPTHPAAAAAIDLYGLGCVAIELARGTPPFTADDLEIERRGHAQLPPPRLADLRPDLPSELSDLVEWLLAKQPTARPPSAEEVLAQLDAILARVGPPTRTVRVLIVEHDTARARWLYSLARRALPSANVEIASEGTDATHKLHRDHPDLVLVNAQLRGVMNALELCMYARGVDSDSTPHLVVFGEVTPSDRAMFAGDVELVPADDRLALAVLERVRAAATATPRRRRPRRTVSG